MKIFLSFLIFTLFTITGFTQDRSFETIEGVIDYETVEGLLNKRMYVYGRGRTMVQVNEIRNFANPIYHLQEHIEDVFVYVIGFTAYKNIDYSCLMLVRPKDSSVKIYDCDYPGAIWASISLIFKYEDFGLEPSI